ncbi:MAG: Hsp20/alpha crystallin family protein [Calditrichia bacterium]
MSYTNYYTPVDLQKEVDRIFGGFINRRVIDRMDSFTPRIDVAETDAAFILEVEAPGLSKEDINVVVEEGVLTISGERKNNEDVKYLQRESGYGTFSRAFNVGDRIEAEKVTASYKDGVLTLNLPKAEKVKPKSIKVKAGK